MQYPPVNTKRDWLRRYTAGEFGNRGPMWFSIEEFEKSGYSGLVHLRNKVASGSSWYNIPAEDARIKWATLPGDFFCAAMAPTSKTILQGEVQRQPSGLYLRYTQIAKPMREALAVEQRHTYGIMGSLLLQRYLCPTSYDWLQVLLDRYDGHVIEFSAYSCNWGTIPHMNTIFWETRNY